MRGKKTDIPIVFEDGESYGRYMEWGDMDVVGKVGKQAEILLRHSRGFQVDHVKFLIGAT